MSCEHALVAGPAETGFTAEWVQHFLGHQSYKITLAMYGTLSIDEMRELAARKPEKEA